MSDLKIKIFRACISQVNERISAIRAAMGDLEGSMTAETKSSAGDKHETARARMQQEQGQLARQLGEWTAMADELARIDPQAMPGPVFNGSLVKTSQGLFFIACALGRLQVDGQEVFVISPRSPIGQAMLHLQKDQEFHVNGRIYRILGIS